LKLWTGAVPATPLAEAVEVGRHGRPKAEIRPQAGASREELLRVLGQIHWTEAESQELKQAMDAASQVFRARNRSDSPGARR
jgi:hypothetical protein